jgi:DNA invertase Pin-like site-specific DNA recombinase
MTTDRGKIQPAHLARDAFVYLRQSSPSQLERNPESTRRQYALVDRAVELGWGRHQVKLVEDDLGLSATGVVDRAGFAHLTAEVALGHVGILLGIEVSRLARNNAEWYRLLDLCGLTDTLIGDGDGLYHPALFNDRLLLGLKGTMSEAEVHILRARLDGGIRNKAARGELRRGLPVGFVWGDADGEVCFHPDAAVIGAVRTVFARFAEMGSVRQVWLWLRAQNLSFPLQSNTLAEIRWVPPTYATIHQVLTNPVYAGAYAYGKTRNERYVDETGRVRKRVRRLPRSQWAVLLPEHHEGFIDWETYEANQVRIAANTRPRSHQAGGAVREGAALLQGLATCGRCSRRLLVEYRGKNATPAYYCANSVLVNGRGERCLQLGGSQIDRAVADAFLHAITPAGIDAALLAASHLETHHDAALQQWRLEVERLRYEAQRAQRRYQAVEPEHRLVARGLEAEWEDRLRELATAQTELARREQQRPRALTTPQRDSIRALGADVNRVWSAPTTTDRDRKELLRTLLEEVNVAVDRAEGQAHLVLRWRGDFLTELDVSLRTVRQPTCRTDEGTLDLMRRLAVHYPDATIASILNRQGRETARGGRFTANKVSSLRRHWNMPRFEPPLEAPEGEVVPVEKAAEIFGVAPSTVHRWLADGFIAGEQLTPGAPWRIRITDELKARFVEQEQDGYLPMIEATRALGVSRQTVLQRVKRGELETIHVRQGRRKGLRIKVVSAQPGLFDTRS